MYTDFAVLVNKEIPWSIDKIKLLDEAVKLFYSNPSHPMAMEVGNLLVQLKEDPDLWEAADAILENAEDSNTKFLALQLLEKAIQVRWKILPEDQKNAIKNYLVTMIVKMGANIHNKAFQHVLKKANMLLIQIVKQEWNTAWKNFIPDICASSQQDQNVCENNLVILKILSEEIYDFSKNQMTSNQVKELKETMHSEFSSIYQLCSFVLKGYLENPQAVRFSLIETCLNTLYAFLSWIPLGYIFLTDLIEILLQIFDVKEFKPACLKCLMEIVVLEVESGCSDDEAKNIKQKLFSLYSNFIFKLGNFIPVEINLLQERTKLVRQKSSGLSQFDDFCQQLALFLSGFMKTHLRWIEPIANDSSNPEQNVTIELIKKGFQYLVHVSELPGQIFKICVDFWNEFTASLLSKNLQGGINGFSNEPLLLLNNQSNLNLTTSVFNLALVQIRSIMISRMAKPVEALLVIDETGKPVKQHVKNTENNSLYEIMRDLLINLTKLDWDNMKSIMISKLDKQLDGTEWSFDNLNALSWAIGSISGTVAPNEEKTFLIYIIRGLLNLTEQKKGKENKAVVASDIMYVVGQYPRFLKSNWNFLRTVVKKLFEFMHEAYPGVMEMACNTFLKIAETCKEEFVIVHTNKNDFQNQFENAPYIDELIRRIPEETNMLEPEHKFVFFEAVGHIVSAEPNFERKQYLLQGILQEYWDAWDTMLREIDMNFESLRDETNIERFYFIIKIHERLAFSVGSDFYKALARIYMDLLKLYILYSRFISNEIQANPKYALNHYIVKKIRGVKKEVVNLMTTMIEKSNDINLVAENFVTPLLDILQDYCSNVPEAREPEVLTLFATIVEKLKGAVAHLVPKILEDVFAATLVMITTDFNSNIDHRVNLFKLILTITENCFQALFNIPAEQFKTVIDCIVWAIKHDLPSIFDSGLEALNLILKNVNTDQNIANQFYQCYYMSLLQDIMYVITDGFHKSGFKLQSNILSLLFQVVATDYVTVPLDSNQTISNKEYIYQYMVDALSKSFNTLSKNQTAQYISNLFSVCNDFGQFRTVLRDYLINLSQYDPEAIEAGDQAGGDDKIE